MQEAKVFNKSDERQAKKGYKKTSKELGKKANKKVARNYRDESMQVK